MEIGTRKKKYLNLSKVVSEAVAESEISKLHLKSINDFSDEIMTDEEFLDWVSMASGKKVDVRKINFNIDVEAGVNPHHKKYDI